MANPLTLAVVVEGEASACFHYVVFLSASVVLFRCDLLGACHEVDLQNWMEQALRSYARIVDLRLMHQSLPTSAIMVNPPKIQVFKSTATV